MKASGFWIPPGRRATSPAGAGRSLSLMRDVSSAMARSHRLQRWDGRHSICLAAMTVRRFARVDRMGFVWLVAGNRVVNVSSSAAVIEMRTGSRQTYRQKQSEPGRVLAWELAPSPR
jgi:hypothetical protein